MNKTFSQITCTNAKVNYSQARLYIDQFNHFVQYPFVAVKRSNSSITLFCAIELPVIRLAHR
ncbi:MAG: hypothetical protein J7460_14975 [Chloroflexus sp.]|nr:hypothetical protein [Chloroflexus sp.]